MLRLFACAICVCCLVMLAAWAEDPNVRDYTCFQTAAPYAPELDIGSDMALVYGVNSSFVDRVAQWRAHGYTVGMMTGISWGSYGDYYMVDGELKRDEIQTVKNGDLLMHGHSTTVGYNVPSPAYVEYIKGLMNPAIDLKVHAIHLEEPEFWARAGWSEGFKKEWERFYGEPWQPPDSSPDAQYRASKLKYELYFNALKEVFAHIKARAKEKGIEVECHVPTHSLINYAQWRIVSPESHLSDLPDFDGYIAQVWTGTARSANIYQGVAKERTFETAFFEYGQMWAMVRPTGRKVWFLADPIEDNPNRSWNDYRSNYERTIIASLMWPEVHRYEVMPWPHRIFKGTYPKVDMNIKTGEREGIPLDYATEILTVINALNDMDQEHVEFDCGSRGVGIVVSDTMMFQRAAPQASDPHLGFFYGLALPLLKAGLPLETVQLENVVQKGALDSYRVLVFTYEGQKPLKPAYHKAIEQWVKEGGVLLCVGDGSDPYHGVREWWNQQGKIERTPYEDLFKRLGASLSTSEPQTVGKGHVLVAKENPADLQRDPGAAVRVRQWVRQALALSGSILDMQHYLLLRRGPYIIVSVLDESISRDPLELKGTFINLFDPALEIREKVRLHPGDVALLYDINWAREHLTMPVAGVASTSIHQESYDEGLYTFRTRGPKGTAAKIHVLMSEAPASVKLTPALPFDQHYNVVEGVLFVSFANTAEDVVVRVKRP
ncbi:MAG: hypothetical protein U9Q79_04555 [Candidatus Hydrogenedentes bacterium]|nr:hypothetical protein [Candidatus Hydrogenedentota bacterium]